MTCRNGGRCVIPQRPYLSWGQNIFLGMVYHRLCESADDSIRDTLLPNGNLRLDIVKHNLDGWGYYSKPDCLSVTISFATGAPAVAAPGVTCPWDRGINHDAWFGLFNFLCAAHADGWRNYA